MDDIYIHCRISREGSFVMASFVFFSLYKYTQFLPDIVCFECCSHHARIICFFGKGKFGIFFDGLSYFFFYVYVEYKRCFHRRSIAITNIYYIYIIARTNKNNYVLLMIVHNPMDPLINDPSLLHD